MLHFLIKGSAQAPYRITAEGAGDSFRMYCSCPAGRNGTDFCKHRQALLLGDIGNLVAPSDDPSRLKEMMAGSRLALKAQTHVPSSGFRAAPSFKTIMDGYAADRQRLETRFPRVEMMSEASPAANLPAEAIYCYGRGVSGRMLKYPVLALEYIPEIADIGFTETGEEVMFNVRPRAKPFRVSGRELSTSPTFASFDRAYQKFAELAGL